MSHTEAIILSMTPQERETPQILNASRKKRVAAGCGLEVADVNRLLKQFELMQELTRQMTRGGRKGGPIDASPQVCRKALRFWAEKTLPVRPCMISRI